jgi:MFS transporter, DHA1 family, tetracycline resistance protein
VSHNMKNSSLFTVFMVVFIGLMGFSFVIPILPFYALEYGANELMLGLLLSSYAVAQLFGAPILGRLSDQYGRRPVLLLSAFGTFVSLVMFAFAQSLTVLFLSRILDGMTGGNISVAQAYITDITDDENRSKGLGMLGAAFGLGFIVGPALGGVLSGLGESTVNPAIAEGGMNFLQQFDWKYTLPGVGAALIGFINVLQIIFTLGESLTEERREEIRESQKDMPNRSIFSVTAIWEATQRPLVGPLLNMRLFFGMAFSMFQTAFPLYAAIQLGLGAAETAFVLTYVGVLAVIIQGYGVGKLSQRYDDKTLLLVSSIMMSVSLVGWGLSFSVPVLLIVLIPIALSGGIFNTVINSALTKAATRQESGSILGVGASMESITRVIAPVLGNSLIAFGAWLPGIVAGVMTGFTSVYVYQRIFKVIDDFPEKRLSSIW